MWTELWAIVTIVPKVAPYFSISATYNFSYNGTISTQLAVAFTDSYSRLPQAVLTAVDRAAAAGSLLFEAWNISYNIPSCLLTDSCTQIFSKFIGTLYTHLGTKYMTTIV